MRLQTPMHSTGQLQKQIQDQLQQTSQALAVLESVLESGIAGICKSRGFFPESFFMERDTGQMTVVQFDMSVLLDYPSPEYGQTRMSPCAPSSDISQTQQSNGRFKKANKPQLSPLTSSMEPMIPISALSSNNGNTDDVYNQLRAEALVLIHWVRKGALQMMHEGRLARIILGICVPSRKRGQDNEKKGKLVESYEFDFSHLPPTKPSILKHDEVQNAYDALFRNLDSYSRTMPPFQKSDSTSLNPERASFNTNASAFLTQNFYGGSIDLPSSRYFNLRIEFTEAIETTKLPCALNPFMSPLNAIASQKNVEVIGKGQKRLVPTSLGQVVEENVTGLGVRLTAFCNDDLPSYEEKDITSNVHLFRLTSPTKVIKKAEPPRVESEERTLIYTSPLPAYDEPSVPLKPDTKAVALPFGLGRDPNYLPCKVLGHRINNKTNKLNYKVLFDHKELIRVKKRKQWITSRKVVSEDIYKQQIRLEIQRYCDDPSISFQNKIQALDCNAIDQIAKRMKVDQSMVLDGFQINDGRIRILSENLQQK